jgi:glycosyltransferase involved in cell wall biosynthesis
MSVLHVISDTDRRGAQIFACDLNEGLTARGRAGETVALVRGAEENGLDVPVLGAKPFALSTLRALRRAIRNASVVIGHGSTTLPATALARLGTGTPFVYRCIGDPVYWSPTRRKRLRTRALLQATAMIVALWGGAADSLADDFGVKRGKLRVIPNGAPADRFPPIDEGMRMVARNRFGFPADARVVLYLGALSREKDLASAVYAIGPLPDTYLLAAGAGPEHARLESLGRDVAPGRLRLTGPVVLPSDALAAADVVVLPSRTEGMPGVLIEAGLCGLPVVATDVGGVGEIVSDGTTGFLVPPRDIEALSAALERALSAPGTMGEAARARCLTHFEMVRVAAAWDELLRELEETR